MAHQAGNAGDVVVADEGLRHQTAIEPAVVALQGPVQLEQVGVLERAPGGLPQFVLGDRVQPGATHVVGIVTMDHLADEPGLAELGADLGQHVLPELRLDGIGGVQAPSVDAPSQPVPHDVCHEVRDGGLVVVEGNQGAVSLEDGGARRVLVPVDPEELRLVAVRPVGQGGAVEGVLVPDVVEDPVEQHDDPALPAGSDQLVEVCFVAQPWVDAEVVSGVIAVGRRAEDGPEQQAVGAQALGIVQPVVQVPEPVGECAFLLARRPHRRPGEAQRVDLPPDGVLEPAHCPDLSSTVGCPHLQCHPAGCAAWMTRKPHPVAPSWPGIR